MVPFGLPGAATQWRRRKIDRIPGSKPLQGRTRRWLLNPPWSRASHSTRRRGNTTRRAPEAAHELVVSTTLCRGPSLAPLPARRSPKARPLPATSFVASCQWVGHRGPGDSGTTAPYHRVGPSMPGLVEHIRKVAFAAFAAFAAECKRVRCAGVGVAPHRCLCRAFATPQRRHVGFFRTPLLARMPGRGFRCQRSCGHVPAHEPRREKRRTGQRAGLDPVRACAEVVLCT